MAKPDGDETWIEALGRIPSGLFVLTARHGDHETGMLASWVQQCSFDPPLITIAVRKGRYVLDWLIDGSAVVVNILPHGAKSLIAHFGKGFELGEPAFAGLELRDDATPPVLLGCNAYVTCRVVQRVDVGDHVLLVGRVEAGEMFTDDKPAVHVRKSGLRY